MKPNEITDVQDLNQSGNIANAVLCAVTVDGRISSSVFQRLTYKCDKKVKFKVSYNNAVNGERKTEYVCGVHKMQFEAWAKRLLKKTDYDVKLDVEPCNGT